MYAIRSYYGVQVIDNVTIETLRDYIDWTPFFLSWELAGKFPRILEDEIVGEEATRLYHDALAMLDRLQQSGEVGVSGIIGLFPANRVGDDIEIYTDETRAEVATKFHFLRQQTDKVSQSRNGEIFPNYCLAD